MIRPGFRFLWLVVVVSLLLKDAIAKPKKCTKKCGKTVNPVCGSDGTTYRSQCKLQNVACSTPGLHRVSVGECSACKRSCSDSYEPVCGSDGVTYDNLCYLDNGACDNPMVSMQASGECRPEVIVTSFQSQVSAKGVTVGLSKVTFRIAVSSATGSQSISGEGLWKLGIYGCRYIDGWCDKVNHVPQILTREQAATPLPPNSRMVISDIIVKKFDVSIIGCEDLPYICTELSKGDNPRPNFELSLDFTDSAISCTKLDCFEQPTLPPPTQACRYECPEVGHTVCGSDGKSYETECALDNERRCGRDPDSYLLQRSYYGACRSGVIIDAIFWSAAAQQSPQGPIGNTVIAIEALIMSNSTGESINGTNLWRLGLFGSKSSDGSGSRLGFRKQLLSRSQASSALAAGRAIVLNVDAEFDVTAVGCSEYKFICIEFTQSDNPRPPFPLKGNVGDAFIACQGVPCTRQPEPELPDDGRKRVVIGQLSWGLQAGRARKDGRYDVTLNVVASLLRKGDYVVGNELLRVGLFGSKYQNGSGPRYAEERQVLTSGNAPRALAPDNNLNIDGVRAAFPVTQVGCSQYIYLCLEIAKGPEAQEDFILISEIAGTSSVDNAAVLCKEIPCNRPGGRPVHPNGGETDDGDTATSALSTGRIRSLNWRLTVDSLNNPKPSDIIISIKATPNPQSDAISGSGLWRVGLYASDDSDPMGVKYRHQRQLLSEYHQSIPLDPSTLLSIDDVNVRFNVQGLGCGELNYICIEFTKGDAPQPDFLLPLPQGDDDGVTKRIASCKPWPCQDPGGGTGGQGGGTGGQGGGTGGQGGGTGGQGGGTGGHGGGTGGHGGGDGGHGGGDGGHGGGDGGGPGPGGHGGGTGGHGGGTGGQDGETGGPSGGADGDAPLVAFSRYVWKSQHKAVKQDGTSEMNIQVTLVPHSSSSSIEGIDMWQVNLFGSNIKNGTGARFAEKLDILSDSERSKPVVLGKDLTFNISTLFQIGYVGCERYPFLCLQFGRNRYSRPIFNLALGRSNTIVTCRQVTCQEPPSESHAGDPYYDPSLPTASFYNMSWTAVAGDSIPGAPTDVNIHAVLFPTADTDTIRGRQLWRLGLFGNAYRTGTGAERIGYVLQILTTRQAGKSLYPDSELEFNIDTQFVLHGFGCGLHRYLCLEFAKHDQPDPDFNFPVESGAHVSCRPFLCREELPTSVPNADRSVARIGVFQWGMEPPRFNPDGLTDIRLYVNVTPTEYTDVIIGRHLWKIGIYGSRKQRGGGPVENRFEYDPQILQVHDARRSLAPGQPLRFDVNTQFDLKSLGCGQYKYFCVEFGKDHLADPDFDLPLSSGNVISNCQLITCRSGVKDNSDTTGGGQGYGDRPVQHGPLKTASFTNISWHILPPTIYANGQSDLNILIGLTPHPLSEDIIGQDHSELWRVGIFANRRSDGTHPQQFNYERQILSQMDRDKSLFPPATLNFEVRVPFDLKRANCDSEFAYLCLEIAKGDTAYPDYNLPLPNGARSLVMCQNTICLPTGPHVSTSDTVDDGYGGATNSEHLPLVTVASVNTETISIRPGEMNRLDVGVVVYMQPGSSPIRGTNLWRVGMWTSASPDGDGARVGFVSQALSRDQTDKNYLPPEPLYFPAVSYSVDMRRKDCEQVMHLCASFTKMEASVPSFAMEAVPNVDVLTVCKPADCSEPMPSQIAITGLTLFNSAASILQTNRVTPLVLGVRVDYDEPESVGFSGSDLWGLKMWLSAKSNGKGKKVGTVQQVLNSEHGSLPLQVGQELLFREVNYRASLLGKKCKDARYVCATLYKNALSSQDYIVIAKPNAKSLTKCMNISCY